MKQLAGSFKRSFTDLLERYLPSRTKRTIFVASFWARLVDTESIDGSTLKKLNDVMVLTTSESALRVPVQLSKVIWKGTTPPQVNSAPLSKSTLTDDQMNTVVENVQRAMPYWLRYAEGEVIKKDVKSLLGHRNTVFG